MKAPLFLLFLVLCGRAAGKLRVPQEGRGSCSTGWLWRLLRSAWPTRPYAAREDALSSLRSGANLHPLAADMARSSRGPARAIPEL